MKGSCIFRPPPTASLIFSLLARHSKPLNHKFQSRNRFTALSTSSVSSPSTSSTSQHHKPQTPLFLRPPTHSSTLSDLHSFISWAETLISKVGPSFEQIDNGPDASLLLRELRWFLDDAVEDPSAVASQNGGLPTKVVSLRASLDQMYKLWGQRIEERRPLQYIVGCEHWRDLVISVEEGVLIPRPETERIVDLVGDVVGMCGGLKEGVWADLGTGSGALAIGIARILGDDGRVVATDLSPVAVAVAKYNVERYGLQDIVEVRQGSWFDSLNHLEGKLAGLVSNPPYIPSKDIDGLQAEVGKHEPRLALDGGTEGLDHLIYLCTRASTMLKSGGFFAFETNGEKQCELLVDYLDNTTGRTFRDVTMVPDFAGIMRFVTGFRK